VTRHAVYFVPEDGTPLADFGQGVLGRDAVGAPVAPLTGPVVVPPAWTARPARYGFHATLKAPFVLAGDTDEMALVEACDALAGTHAPIPLAGLAPARHGAFAALVLPAALEPLDRLAADCVIGLEPFRAPLDAAAVARRRPDTLDPAARARLERWGYPHVLEGFRFHMTLSAVLPDEGEAGELAATWLDALIARYRSSVGDRAVFDRLALCREATPSSPFVRLAEFPLRG